MTISRINSTPVFKGYMYFYGTKMENGEPKGDGKLRKVDASDVLDIENRPYSKSCIIQCISNKEGCDEVSYYVQQDFNTILNAYIAAKLSDGQFKVKM